MSSLEIQQHQPGLDAGEPSLAALIEDAKRQLTICNACRYCEGLCPVFPALERRALISDGDLTQLANLCHDCRACLDACMYSPPHEYDLDLPTALTAARLADYRRYVWPVEVPGIFRGRSGLLIGAAISVVIVVSLAVLHAGWSGLTRATGSGASPYQLIPSGTLLALMLIATAYGAVVFAWAARSFWVATESGTTRIGWRAISSAVWQAATLAHMRGGGADCYYTETDQPSPQRRRLHHMVSYGFGLCFVSTASAAVIQHLAGRQPPYPWLSVPVLSGTVGGVAMVVGCGGLVVLKMRGRSASVLPEMTVKDYGLLSALMFLAGTGVMVLLTRETHVYGLVLIIHLAAVMECLAMAPYSKFVHVVFRFLSLVRDNAEIGTAGA